MVKKVVFLIFLKAGRIWTRPFVASLEALARPRAPNPARKNSTRVQTKGQWRPREVSGPRPSKHHPGYIPKLASKVVKKVVFHLYNYCIGSALCVNFLVYITNEQPELHTFLAIAWALSNKYSRITVTAIAWAQAF
jgi:hypothetical protein